MAIETLGKGNLHPGRENGNWHPGSERGSWHLLVSLSWAQVAWQVGQGGSVPAIFSPWGHSKRRNHTRGNQAGAVGQGTAGRCLAEAKDSRAQLALSNEGFPELLNKPWCFGGTRDCPHLPTVPPALAELGHPGSLLLSHSLSSVTE